MIRCRGWLQEGWALVGSELPTFTMAAFIVVSASMLSAFVIVLPLIVGMCIMVIEKRHNKAPQLSHLWEGFTRFPAASVTWIIVLLVTIPTYSLSVYLHHLLGGGNTFIVLGIEFLSHCIVWTPLFFVLPVIADRDCSAKEAIRLSWAQVRKAPLQFFKCALAYSLLLAFGVFSCLFGLLIVLPVVVAAVVIAYEELYGGFEVPRMIPIKEPENEEKESEEEDEVQV